MVGGIIIGIARREDSALVHVQDRQRSKETCSIRLVERKECNGQPVQIELGDSIWWQGGSALWTPKKNARQSNSSLKDGVDYDIRLPRIGFSH